VAVRRRSAPTLFCLGLLAADGVATAEIDGERALLGSQAANWAIYPLNECKSSDILMVLAHPP
jgi:hypothetical protein